MPLPITPNKSLQEENKLLRKSNSEIRQKIFDMFRYYTDNRNGILLLSNFEAIRPKYLLSFTAEEIQAELKNMEKDGYLLFEGDKICLTPKGKKVVYNI